MSKKRVTEIFLSDVVASQFSAPVKRSIGINNQRHSQSTQRGARPGPLVLCPSLPWEAGPPHSLPAVNSWVLLLGIAACRGR